MWRLGFAVGLVLSLLLVSCRGDDQFILSAASEFFTVDYNPAYVDVLWVVDDRSPMSNMKAQLVAEASKFFERLDANTSNYRMGIISADSQYAQGRLKPDGGGVILTKNYGTVQQRSQSFGSILSQVINLHTGASANGLQASLQALGSTFIPVTGAPLVVVYVSDGEDHSEISGQDAVDYYASELTKIKGGNKALLRVYSINLKALAGAAKSSANRCTTLDQAEIDVLSHFGASQPTFEDRYFRLADKLGGEKADLCGPFASRISLDALKLKELPSRFKLKSQPKSTSLKVTLFRGETELAVPAWRYEPATNEIVFAAAPEAGSTIYVSYDQSGV